MQPEISNLGPRQFLNDVRTALLALPFERIEIRPMSPTIGAEIHGVDLSKPLDDATLAEVRSALLEYKAIFFRDQRLTTEQHVNFARRFGELEVHPFLPSNTDFPELVRFEKNEETKGVENTWHSDVSWRLEPSLGSVLRCIHAPPVGGDTRLRPRCRKY